MTFPRPSRQFYAEDVLGGRIDLDNYPFRYAFVMIGDVSTVRAGHAGLLHRMDVVFSAVEFMEARGWECLNVVDNGQVAYMRKVAR
ncbi:hypothetical protein [Winogradskya humida]|uniref:Uncharacterized protein n=1 Tax=Winogradskya humida TaxID=113566 RepID=A0ABQ3ZWP3_9ACTN|nr:hypothetical protein [Actinoplanes humidus]GIE22612.1 hypothetical protein Ahu01nite_057140 [Actinoplanes humidus]